jgi:hypothetical protein
MATHDYIISNASGAAVRADLNNALAAIASNNSSATEPTTTYAYQWWADTGSSPTVMKLRNAANSAWVTLFQLDGEWSLIPFENGTAAAPSIYFKDSGTDTGIYSPGADQVAITTGGTRRATVDASGRLLVSTSSTSATGSVFIQGNSGASTGAGYLNLQRGQAAGASISAGSLLGAIQFTDNSSNIFAQIYSEGDAASGAGDYPGRLVFSTTADGAPSPTERMRIGNEGSTNHYTDHTNVHIARSGNAAGTTDSIYVGARNATNTTNGTVVYRVYTNGTYATISDANQKKNVQTTRDGYLDDLNKLRVVKYNWNEQEDTDPKELGLIAQEVEQVFPGLVTKIADDTEEQQYKGIKTSVLPFMLLKALQEASAKIEVLEAEVAALKAQ